MTTFKGTDLLDLLVCEPLPGVEHEQYDHLVGVDVEDVLLVSRLAPVATTTTSSSCCCCSSLLLLVLPLPLPAVEDSVEVSCASTRLQGQDTTAVLGQVKVLEHIEGLKYKI